MTNMLDYGVIIMLYLLTQLTPTNKNLTFTVTTDTMSEKIIINYDAKAKKWFGKSKNEDDNKVVMISVDKKTQVFMFGEEKIRINDLVVDDAKINWKTATSINVPTRDNMPQQNPIIIKRNKKSIQLSQKEGDLARLRNMTFSW